MAQQRIAKPGHLWTEEQEKAANKQPDVHIGIEALAGICLKARLRLVYTQ